MDKPFKEILIEAIEAKGMSLNKLADLSRVPERYLEFMVRDEFENLPSAPYLHGYIIRISQALEIDGELIWQAFKKEHQLKTSGSSDSLPKNRFAQKTAFGNKLYIGITFVIILSLYVGLRFNALFGRPNLVILDPIQESIIVTNSSHIIRGSTDNDAKLTINNEVINVSDNGSFLKEVLLDGGLNSFSITAKKLLGQEVSTTRQIIYDRPDTATTTENIFPLIPITDETATITPDNNESNSDTINNDNEEDEGN